MEPAGDAQIPVLDYTHARANPNVANALDDVRSRLTIVKELKEWLR